MLVSYLSKAQTTGDTFSDTSIACHRPCRSVFRRPESGRQRRSAVDRDTSDRLEALIDDTVELAGRVGGARPGRKVLTLAHAMIAGGTHIDHADMLRAGSTAAVLGHRVMTPSTLGTFLRYAEAAFMPSWRLWGLRRPGLGLTDSA